MIKAFMTNRSNRWQLLLVVLLLITIAILVQPNIAQAPNQASAQATIGSTDTDDSMAVDSIKGLFYTLSDSTSEVKVTIGDVSSKVFTPTATLSKWGNEATLKVSLPEPEPKSFTWDTALKLPAIVTRENGKLVVIPERVVYPYDDITDVIFYELPPDEQNEEGAFEYELKVYELPNSNVFTFNIETENLVFYYQPALTQKEIDAGDIRPENIIGSYAVYHASKANNEYKTGKAFHIYRPKVIDSTGDWIWAELYIDSKVGLMTVTIDQTWLDKAIYPITIDPTFGKTAKGGSGKTLNGSNFIRASVFTGAVGIASSITTYIKFYSTPALIKLAIYTSGGTFVKGTEEWETTDGYDNWKTFSLTSSATVTAQSYALSRWSDGGSYRYYDTGVSGNEKYKSLAYGAWPGSVVFSDADLIYSIYVTYTAPPTVVTDPADNITRTTARLNGRITANGGADASSIKWEWDTDAPGAPYTYNYTYSAGGYGVGSYYHDIGSIYCGDTVYFRMTATNTGGIGYGAEDDFTTDVCTAPVVVTDGATNLTYNSATLSGNITNDGGNIPDYYKFEWDIDSGAPYTYNYTSPESSYPVGSYSRNISSLSEGTLYYWQFSAHNVIDWGNSSEDKFLTLPVKPSLLVDGAKTSETIAYTWSKGAGGNRTMVRYSDVNYPTAIDEGTQAYYDTGELTTITGLDPSTYYYISAWSEITTDGMQQFSSNYATDTAWTRPDDVVTFTATNFTVSTADLDWVIPDGADYVRIRSKIGSVPTSPSDGTHVYYGNGMDYTVPGLQPSSHYYFAIWGYYTTSTLYSENPASAHDWTLVDVPIITNSYGASGVGKTSATLNGAVTYTGGDNPDCFFYWGDDNPGFDRFSWDNEEIMGEQSGDFSIPLSDLIEGTTYYYVTYGENSVGSDWAPSVVEFTCGCLVVEDLDVTKINTYQFDFTWTPKATITTIRMGIDNPPANALDGTLVYRGNGTSTSWYFDTNCTSGNMTFRAWSDCTACLTCTTLAFSDTYSEDSVILSGNCTGGGGGGDMYKVVYDTNDDGVVDAADYATNAGDADTLDGLHAGEISGTGYGNITFVTDGGNATTLEGIINILGMGTISTFGGNNTIQISGTTFLSLPDTPDSYAGQGGLYVVVNEGENALEFVTGNITGSGTGNITFVTMSGNATSIDGVITMDGIDIETSGTEGTISLAIGGENVDTLATNSTLLIVFGIPFLLGVIGVWRNSITGYLAGIIGLSLSLGFMYDNIGMALAVVVLLVILGLIGSAIRNAWGEGLRVF